MLRLYLLLSSRLQTFLSRHEKSIYTTGARLLAVVCVIIAIIIAQRLGRKLF